MLVVEEHVFCRTAEGNDEGLHHRRLSHSWSHRQHDCLTVSICAKSGDWCHFWEILLNPRPRLAWPHPTILLPPAIVRLLRNLQLLTHVRDLLALRNLSTILRHLQVKISEVKVRFASSTFWKRGPAPGPPGLFKAWQGRGRAAGISFRQFREVPLEVVSGDRDRLFRVRLSRLRLGAGRDFVTARRIFESKSVGDCIHVISK